MNQIYIVCVSSYMYEEMVHKARVNPLCLFLDRVCPFAKINYGYTYANLYIYFKALMDFLTWTAKKKGKIRKWIHLK